MVDQGVVGRLLGIWPGLLSGGIGIGPVAILHDPENAVGVAALQMQSLGAEIVVDSFGNATLWPGGSGLHGGVSLYAPPPPPPVYVPVPPVLDPLPPPVYVPVPPHPPGSDIITMPIMTVPPSVPAPSRGGISGPVLIGIAALVGGALWWRSQGAS